MPVTITENVAPCPATAVWLAGWLVTTGATAVALTVKVALLLVTLPAELLTAALYSAPLSALVVAPVV